MTPTESFSRIKYNLLPLHSDAHESGLRFCISLGMKLCYAFWEMSRRALLMDEQLIKVMGHHSALECFKISSCSRVTDAALASLPADSLRELSLVSCDGIEGTSLGCLRKLETLELSYCNAVTEHTIRVSAAAGSVAVNLTC
jgi:hypothetical protein